MRVVHQFWKFNYHIKLYRFNRFLFKNFLAAVGFEPTPPQRLEPKSSALDHSATLPTISKNFCINQVTHYFKVNII